MGPGGVVALGEDEGGELAALDAARVDTLGVLGELEATVRVVAVDDGRAVVFVEGGLVFVPELFFLEGKKENRVSDFFDLFIFLGLGKRVGIFF